jgi:hypothetical protein
MSEKTTEYDGIAVDFAKLQQELFDQVRAFFEGCNFNSLFNHSQSFTKIVSRISHNCTDFFLFSSWLEIDFYDPCRQ